jgi:hypothetical protein
MAAAQLSQLFQLAVSRAPRLLIQCIAVDIRFLLTTFKDDAGNNFLRNADIKKSSLHVEFLLVKLKTLF